uniref:Type 4 fimbrial biogenesis protein PilX N-terminal domain-containing protein n=1 Tax=Dictyoglomus thermophilum TaxID=14 RepID=A0A7C3MQ30_DICTH
MRKGQILVAVLLVFAILSLVISGVISMWEGNIKSISAQIGEKQALYLAEGVAEIAIYSLTWLVNPSAYFANTYTFSFTGFWGTAKLEYNYNSTENSFVISATAQVESVYTGESYIYTRALNIEGVRTGTSAPYSLTINKWTEE